LGRRAAVAADLRYSLNSESHESSTMTMEVAPGVMMESTSELNWKDAWVASAGGEYFVTERVPVRAGYALQRSATPEETATSYYRPPGLGHSVHLGTGLRLANLDLAGYYSFASTDIESGPSAGHYSLNQLALSVGGSYHF
jgi:long-subunit fatty acid transport protein